MVSSVSEAVERQGLAHSKICAKKTAGPKWRDAGASGSEAQAVFGKYYPAGCGDFSRQAPTGAASCLGVKPVNTFASANRTRHCDRLGNGLKKEEDVIREQLKKMLAADHQRMIEPPQLPNYQGR